MADTERKPALIQAVQDNAFNLLTSLIDAGADVNVAGTNHKTALIYAVYSDNDGFVGALIAAGADLNKSDIDRKTALIHAIENNKEARAVALIKAGANANKRDKWMKTPLIYAVLNENECLARALIDAEADVNATDIKHKTALFYALYNGQKIVDILVKAGADVNITDNEGKTALFYAVKESDNESVVGALIDAGADVNITDNEGKTALFYAVRTRYRSASKVRALIDVGADVNITDNEGKTALFYAVQNDNESVARALIDAGVDVNATDNDYKTALVHANQNGNERMAKFLISKGADVNITDDEWKTALIHAAKNNEPSDVINERIGAGTDVNIIDIEGKTAPTYAVQYENIGLTTLMYENINLASKPTQPGAETVLIYAIQHQLEDVAEEVIAAGADVNITDNEGKTALFYAVSLADHFFVSVLIDADADVNIIDNEEKTALFYAVQQSDNESVVGALIDAGADVNITDNEGKTALIYAIQLSHHESVLRALIDAGADVNVNDNEGKTALIYAIHLRYHESVVRALIDAGADVNVNDNEGKIPLIYAIQLSHHESVVRALIDAGADVNVNDNEGKTALIYAIHLRYHESVVRALIDAGADVNIIDNEGKTTLFYAVQQSDNESVVRALIAAGADVNITDNEGKTALIDAVQQSNNESVVCALIDAGTDVNRTDNEGKTALIVAVQNEEESLVRALIEAGANVNKTDIDGKTALLFATSNELLVHMLIEAGSDTNIIDKEGKTSLFYAVENEFVVRELVENGKTNVNSRDVYGRTPLFYSFPKSLASAQYLLEKGANLLVKDDCNLSILSFFINYCLLNKLDQSYMSDSLQFFLKQRVTKTEVLQAIVNGVFCNILSSYSVLKSSCDALTLASHYCVPTKVTCEVLTKISRSMKELIHYHKLRDDANEHSSGSQLPRIFVALIDLNDEPNSTDSDGNTALHHGACLPFMDAFLPHDQVMYICHQLEKFGISFNVRNHRDETPLLFCVGRGIHEVMTQKEKCRWPRGEIFLHVCKFLLEHGSSVKGTTSTGDSIFHLVLKLFQQGIGIVNRDQGKVILSEAVKLLELIVHRMGASMSTSYKTNKSRDTPLHLWASLKLSLDQDYKRIIFKNYTFERALKTIFDQLLECGILLNGRNAKEETPLHLCRTWTAVIILLENGGNVKDVDKEGRSPLLVAAKNSKFDQSSTCFYPDITVEPKVFWITALERGLDPWTVDKNGESVLSVLIASEAFVLADALVEVASQENYLQGDTIALSLLNAICKDVSTRAHWKSALVEKIIKSRDVLVSVKGEKDTPLHYCIRNIVKKHSNESSVHWTIAKLLLSYGADCTIPNEAGETCLDIANSHPRLSEFLKKPISIDEVPLLIPWLSVSKRYNPILAKAARRQECEHVAPFWYHKNHLASGSFGLVFAGINERDGREVAIKRIEKLRLQESVARTEEKREISNLTALADCEQVVRYLSCFEDKDFFYVVLELMEGNIDEFLNSTVLVQETAKLCHDIVKGLEFLHSSYILHRDLKPANILYKTYPKLCLKIADFGLSRRIDIIGSTTVYGTNAGTRCWIAPEVLTSTKPGNQHSKASDMFSCGLLLHYILTVKKHPFFPADCDQKNSMQVTNEAEKNLIVGNMEGWSDTLCSESTHLVKQLLASEASERPTAALALAHPFFWSETKKMDLLNAVGNQPEIECPRAKRTPPLTAVESDLEANFGTIVKYGDWNDPRYVHMPANYTEMMKKRKTPYDTKSVVELVRFIRNAIAHVSESPRPTSIRKLLLEDFVFLEYFPNLVIEVYKAVITHGWDQTIEEIQYAMNK